MPRDDEFTALLSPYLDGELDQAARARIEAHLAGCLACRRALEDLRAIVAAAPGYAGTAPDRDLWPDIARRLDQPDIVPLPAPAPGRQAARRGFRFSLPELIAASVVLTAIGASAAWLALRGGAPDRGVSVVQGDSPAAAGRPDSSVAITMAAANERYDAAVEDLEQILDAGKSRLDTATVRVIEESLRRIDTAIADARAAIQRDPANAYLNRQVTANLRRKLNLLRIAAKAIAES